MPLVLNDSPYPDSPVVAMFSTILHPTDLSDASTPALKAAHDLAKSLGSKLLICYLAHPPLIASGSQLTNPETNEVQDLDRAVNELQPIDPKVNCEVKIVMTEQSTAPKKVLALLEQLGCDLIVLGMHKHEGLMGWLGGSVTEDVVSQANCAVLVVKQHGEQREEESDDS